MKTSLIVTTNLPFESWIEVLGSERLIGAMLDRLTHRCKIIEAKGESYRLKDTKARSRLQPKTKEAKGGENEQSLRRPEHERLG